MYTGDTDKDVILYKHVDRSGRNKPTYSIGYADPHYYITFMIGVYSKRAIDKRIRNNGFVVVKTVVREYGKNTE
jgi:hypothetical protein